MATERLSLDTIESYIEFNILEKQMVNTMQMFIEKKGKLFHGITVPKA